MVDMNAIALTATALIKNSTFYGINFMLAQTMTATGAAPNAVINHSANMEADLLEASAQLL